MRKIISAGIVIIAFANGAKAETHDITIKLGGRLDSMVGYRRQQGIYNNKARSIEDLTSGSQTPLPNPLLNRGAIVNDTKIYINVDGKVNEDLTYGGVIWLHADTSHASSGERSIGDKTMTYIQHNRLGRLEVGNYPGAGGVFEMDITNIAKAAYGVHGYWAAWVNNGAYIKINSSPILLEKLIGHKYAIVPNLPSNSSGDSYSDAPKATFYTKPFTGLTVGISYKPDLDSTGSISGVAHKDSGPVNLGRAGYRPTFRNIITGGFQYENKIYDVSYKLSASAEVGKAKKYQGTSLIRDLKAYEVGIKLGYQDFQIAASYGDWFKTGTYKQTQPNTKQGSKYWTLGFSHDIGKFGYSLTYIQSKRAGGLEAIGGQIQKYMRQAIKEDDNYSDKKYNKLKNISLGAEYKIANGLLPYVEVSKFTFKDSSDQASNSGYIFLSGLRVAF